MAGVKTGYDWEKIFSKCMRRDYPECHLYKHIDTHAIQGLLTKLKKSNHSQWDEFKIPKVPADYTFISNGKWSYIEVKSTQNATSLPLRNIKDHQLETASEVELAGGTYWFVVRREERGAHECFVLSLNDIIRHQANLGRQSIPWETLRADDSVIKPKWSGRGSTFDFKGVFE